jgi:hypothetical protein
MQITLLKFITVIGFSSFLLSGCQQDNPQTQVLSELDQNQSITKKTYSLTVYKTPSCGCCTEWLEHLAESGVPNQGKNLPSLAELKSELNISPKYRSCHTGISKDGYVFEGHVPAKYIKQFLQNPPEDALGLSVPAMPIGSPGMEVDDGKGGSKFMPYRVLLLKKDGSAEIYANVTDYPSQF